MLHCQCFRLVGSASMITVLIAYVWPFCEAITRLLTVSVCLALSMDYSGLDLHAAKR
jgi:hypothetical protein